MFWDFLQTEMECTNPRCRVTPSTQFWTLVPQRLWVLNMELAHVTLLVPRILRWLLDLWKICAYILIYLLTPKLVSSPFPGGSPPSWTSPDSTDSVGGSWEVIRIARMACSRCHCFEVLLVSVIPRLVLGGWQPPAHGSFSSGFMSPNFLPPLLCKSEPSSSRLGPETRKWISTFQLIYMWYSEVLFVPDTCHYVLVHTLSFHSYWNPLFMCRLPARLDFILLSVPCFTSSNLSKNKRSILLIAIILELAMVLLVMKFPVIYGNKLSETTLYNCTLSIQDMSAKIIPIYAYGYKLVAAHQIFQLKFCKYFSFPHWALRDHPNTVLYRSDLNFIQLFLF